MIKKGCKKRWRLAYRSLCNTWSQQKKRIGFRWVLGKSKKGGGLCSCGLLLRAGQKKQITYGQPQLPTFSSVRGGG